MLYAHALFLSQVGCYLIFSVVSAYVDEAAQKEAERAERDKESILIDEEKLDPTFRELLRLRDACRDCGSSRTRFTEQSLLQRKEIDVERRWKLIFGGMSDEEKAVYTEVLRRRGESAGSSMTGGSASLFRQVMDHNIQGDERQALYQSILGQSAFAGKAASSEQKPTFTSALKNLIAPLKLLVSWIFIHLIVGWAPRVSGLPMFTFPNSFLWPILAQEGSTHFPFSMVLSDMSPQATQDYLMHWDQVGSNMNFASSPPICRRFVTFGWVATTFLIGTSIVHLKKELLRREGCVWRAFKLCTKKSTC